MEKKLETEIEEILEMEVESLKKGGTPPSSAFFISPKGKFVVDGFDFRDKPKSKRLLKKIGKKHKAIMIITVAHGLVSKYESTASGPPYFRRDALIAYGETKHSDFGIIQEFERKKNNQIKLGRKTTLPEGSEGPMTGFMRRK